MLSFQSTKCSPDVRNNLDSMARTMRLAWINLASLPVLFFCQGVAQGYHFSMDFTDGQMLIIWWTLFGVPLLTAVTAVSGLLERGHRGRVFWAPLGVSAVPAGVSLFTWVIMFGILQRIREWW